MAENKFPPENVPGEKICEYDRKELCEFVSRLCEKIREDSPSGTYRGGIFPNNISVDENGDVSIGKAAPGAWTGQELEFLPPEIFWNGHAGSASDVYSLGLLLYFAVSGGKLPFNDSKEAQQRRMNGEDFSIPKSAGRRLGEIIRKATAFNAKDRYSCPAELKAVLDSCVKNLYLNDEPSAVAVFGKSDDDLSDTERMMVEIIEKNNGIESDEPTEEEQAEDMSKKTENDSITAETAENEAPKTPDTAEPAGKNEAAKTAPAESRPE